MVPEPTARIQINLAWLILLRWSMVVGQLATILGVRIGLELSLPFEPLLVIVGVEAAVNVGATFVSRRYEPRAWWLGGLMAFDVVMCTGLLYFTGGPSNPFSFVYLVQIALAAVTLEAAWTWALAALALAGSGVLFLVHRPLPTSGSHAVDMELHLRGMWVAFGVAAGFIVYFLRRVRRALEEREAELAASRLVAARQERLASLATLAAGAAHELSTPLATIAVVTKELERHASLVRVDEETTNDIRLVREQVDRCRAILERMSSDAGESIGESFVAAPLGTVVSNAVGGLPSRAPIRTEIVNGAGDTRLRVPPRALSQALRGILKNAQEASPDEAEVLLRVHAQGNALRFEIHDAGPGIPSDVLDRIGEPFFTTKPPGKGMGLGVFLARAVVERLGGELRFSSSAGRGTIAIVELPARLVEPHVVAP